MTNIQTLVTYSTTLAAGVVADAQAFVAPSKPPEDLTPDECRAVLVISLVAAAVVEAHAASALPADEAANVRAFTERLVSDIQKAKNLALLNPQPPQGV